MTGKASDAQPPQRLLCPHTHREPDEWVGVVHVMVGPTCTLYPPSAMTTDPTRKLALSDARNATTSAISSGCAARPMGAFLPCLARNSRPSGMKWFRRFVTTSPAPTALTRMPCWMFSTASTRVSCANPPLEAQYAAIDGKPK